MEKMSYEKQIINFELKTIQNSHYIKHNFATFSSKDHAQEVTVVVLLMDKANLKRCQQKSSKNTKNSEILTK